MYCIYIVEIICNDLAFFLKCVYDVIANCTLTPTIKFEHHFQMFNRVMYYFFCFYIYLCNSRITNWVRVV